MEVNYPEKMLLIQFLEEIHKTPIRNATIISTKTDIFPMMLDGVMINCGQGMWMASSKIGNEGRLLPLNLGDDFRFLQNEYSYRAFRFAMFYTRLSDPTINYNWDLEGVITFEFGLNSIVDLQTAIVKNWF